MMSSAAQHDDPADAGSGPIELRQGQAVERSSTSHGGAGSQDLAQAITILRARVDEEFKIAERLDSKGRQAFALAAGFFAVVQTVTFGSFAQNTITSGERPFLLAMAVLAGACVAAVGHRLTHGEDLLGEADMKPEAIVEWCNEADENDYVAVRLVAELSRMARRRAENNAIRAKNYDAVANAARVALVVAGVELLVAIVVRL
jgi:predicted alpha/beta hydrolase